MHIQTDEYNVDAVMSYLNINSIHTYISTKYISVPTLLYKKYKVAVMYAEVLIRIINYN